MKTIAFEMKKCKHCKKRCRHKVIIEVNNGWRIVYSECKCCQHYEKKTEVIGEENE
jgi:MinD superfamily P-loop ATPase